MKGVIISQILKVAWLGSGFINRSASGTAQTAKKAVENLSRNHSDKIEITILVKSLSDARVAQKDPNLSKCKIELLDNRKRRFLASSRQYYRYCWQNRGNKVFDVLHFSVPRVYPNFYWFPAKKFVATFHAAGDITVPVDKFVFSKHVYNTIIKLQWRKFDAIIADSDFAVNEISNAYKIPYTKISKIFVGADTLWGLTNENISQKTQKIVIMGRWQKYKNVHTALMAIFNFNKCSTNPLRVTLIGKSNQLGKELVQKEVDKFHEDDIELIEYLSNSDLAKAYREAMLVIHPSINEGFGLPAFEAFGEGSTIIVHSETPAAELLTKFPGVIAENLETVHGVKQAIHKSQLNFNVSIDQRRSYITSIGATWEQMASAYVRTYLGLF